MGGICQQICFGEKYEEKNLPGICQQNSLQQNIKKQKCAKKLMRSFPPNF